ncbi:MAG: DUF3047 domain-containing protein [Alphaproteobacteria bacterium]|nr:DUF3047 domain-containing protein [Alphaproteobacteria bacterium]
MAEPTTGLPALMTLGRALIERLKSGRGKPGPGLAQIDLLARKIADRHAVAGIAAYITVDLTPGMQDWHDTGFHVDEGDEVTLFAGGDITLSRLADVRMGPKVALWYRIGRNGAMHKFPTASPSFRADEAGALYLALQPPGDWANESGDFDPSKILHGAGGRMRVVVVKWRDGAERGLKALLHVDKSGLAGDALIQWRYPVRHPQGWQYLWRLGEGEIYTADAEYGHICCHTAADVGILQIPVDFALADATRFSWKWRATVLPSSIREDIQPTHDYLSIAVEFDNGLDLTYMWSSELPTGTIFQCPLPWWDERETHWVLRSSAGDLGKWLTEDRNIKSDYAQAIGGVAPERIVGVWLIANSVFQRGEGKCDYADIMLSNTGQQLALV